MKATNTITRFVLPVFTAIAIGSFGFIALGQSSADSNGVTIYRMTDVHERVDLSQLQQAGGTNVYALSDTQRLQRIQDVESARWLAMASFYEKQASEASLTDSQLDKPLTSYDEAEAMAYRWQAMAKFYQKQQEMVCSSQLPKPLTEYDAAEADAYRWQAIYNYYLQYGLATIR